MSLIIFEILYLTVFLSFYSIIAKLLTRGKLRLKESIYFALAALILAIGNFMAFYFSVPVALFGLVQTLLFFLYFYKINSYSMQKSFILTLFVMIIGNVVNLLVITVFIALFPAYHMSLLEPFTSVLLFLRAIPFALIHLIAAALVTPLFVKASRKLRERINQSKGAQTVLAWTSIALLAIMQLASTIMQFQNEFLEFVTSWEVFFLVGFSGTVFVSFFFYMRSERERTALQQKKVEQQLQQEYTEHIEAQHIGMRRFKHDYQNILLAIDGFADAEDWDGLKRYMPKVKAASSIIIKDEFALVNLSKIRLPEIKGLLAAKLMLAQNISMDIHTTFEAHEEINHIPVDSVVLVRMLGIIMDNAIEELAYLGAGELMVACYKNGLGITFVVQNTCRPDIEPLYKLKQMGHSNKGEGRGLGLSNLTELVAAHSDDLSLQTSIEDGTFTQKLWIGGAG